MRVLLILPMILILTSCSTMNSSFDCPNKDGINCKSLDEINTMVDQAEGGGVSQVITPCSRCQNRPSFQAYTTTTSINLNEPTKTNDIVKRVWLAPYEDKEGNYHTDTYVYTVAKQGHWINTPAKANLVVKE